MSYAKPLYRSLLNAEFSKGNTGPTGGTGPMGPEGTFPTTIQDATSEPMGHEVRTNSVISFSEGVFTIAPAFDSYRVWVKGTPFDISNVQTATIPDASGLYYIYFDDTGNIGVQTDYFTWDQQAPTAYLYFNPSNADEYMLFDERHGITMDWATHEYLHRTRGAAIANGFQLSYPSLELPTPTNSDLEISLAEGTFFDEDLQVDITDGSPDIWSTPLSPLLHPILYLDGSVWRKRSSSTYPLLNGGVAGRPYYNLISSGTTGSLQTVSNNHFVNAWLVATNMAYTPIVVIMDQKEYTNVDKATTARWENLELNGLPIVELRPLYQLTYRCSDSYNTNDYYSSLFYVTDIRSFSSITGIATANIGPTGPTGPAVEFNPNDMTLSYVLNNGNQANQSIDMSINQITNVSQIRFNNTILLNATGAEFNTSTDNAFYVKPIRQDTSETTDHALLVYDASNGEVISSGYTVQNITDMLNEILSLQADVANLQAQMNPP